MRLGIAIEETWSFFNEIYTELAEHHQTSLFKTKSVNLPFFSERINRHISQSDWTKFLRENDVVFFEWASALLSYATHQRKTCGVVTRLHRYEMYHWANRIDWNLVDRVILVSKAKQREFGERFPQQIEKTIVIPEAISVEKFHPSLKSFTGDIGILCHLTPRKRVYETILAFYELIQEEDRFHLHIAGGEHELHGDYYRALQTIVSELGLQSKITFYGNIKNPEAWYQNIDIFLSNSYSEGLQLAPMEAMASGCFVLSHHWEGADELLPNENLFYTDTELITKILNYCYASKNKKEETRLMLRQIVVKNFNIDQIKSQIRLLTEDVAQNYTA